MCKVLHSSCSMYARDLPDICIALSPDKSLVHMLQLSTGTCQPVDCRMSKTFQQWLFPYLARSIKQRNVRELMYRVRSLTWLLSWDALASGGQNWSCCIIDKWNYSRHHLISRYLSKYRRCFHIYNYL